MIVVSFLMDDVSNAAQMASDYNNHVSETGGVFTGDINEIKFYRTMIPNMISIILVAFSAIIVGICMIVVRFRIITGIQDGMTNIGILKATGNTSGQIIASIVLQYGSITALSGFLGILVSFFTTPVLSSAFAGLIGKVAVMSKSLETLLPLRSPVLMRGVEVRSRFRQCLSQHNHSTPEMPIFRSAMIGKKKICFSSTP
jgi:ABC-type antimicrobial peptide transport system permease subunit